MIYPSIPSVDLAAWCNNGPMEPTALQWSVVKEVCNLMSFARPKERRHKKKPLVYAHMRVRHHAAIVGGAYTNFTNVRGE